MTHLLPEYPTQNSFLMSSDVWSEGRFVRLSKRPDWHELMIASKLVLIKIVSPTSIKNNFFA